MSLEWRLGVSCLPCFSVELRTPTVFLNRTLSFCVQFSNLSTLRCFILPNPSCVLFDRAQRQSEWRQWSVWMWGIVICNIRNIRFSLLKPIVNQEKLVWYNWSDVGSPLGKTQRLEGVTVMNILLWIWQG